MLYTSSPSKTFVDELRDLEQNLGRPSNHREHCPTVSHVKRNYTSNSHCFCVAIASPICAKSLFAALSASPQFPKASGQQLLRYLDEFAGAFPMTDINCLWFARQCVILLPSSLANSCARTNAKQQLNEEAVAAAS